MKFIGIDLGWVSGASGLCCLQWQDKKLQLQSLTTKLETTAVFEWLDQWVSGSEAAMVAVDAPTIIPNQTGTRLPDKLTHKYFGKYHAGCYPANLNRPFANRTVSFGNQLLAKGFLHAPQIIPQKLGRYQIEVFPHPAIVNLFGLEKILKYKKGKLAEKKHELENLSNYITTFLTQLEPQLSFKINHILPKITHQITGRQLKEIEDQLDSLICAYVAAYWWYWGEIDGKNIVLGNLNEGYIIVPNRISKL